MPMQSHASCGAADDPVRWNSIHSVKLLPDLGPCDFHFFSKLKRNIRVFIWGSEGVSEVVDQEQTADILLWHDEKTGAPVKCIAVNGDFVEK